MFRRDPYDRNTSSYVFLRNKYHATRGPTALRRRRRPAPVLTRADDELALAPTGRSRSSSSASGRSPELRQSSSLEITEHRFPRPRANRRRPQGRARRQQGHLRPRCRRRRARDERVRARRGACRSLSVRRFRFAPRAEATKPAAERASRRVLVLPPHRGGSRGSESSKSSSRFIIAAATMSSDMSTSSSSSSSPAPAPSPPPPPRTE